MHTPWLGQSRDLKQSRTRKSSDPALDYVRDAQILVHATAAGRVSQVALNHQHHRLQLLIMANVQLTGGICKRLTTTTDEDELEALFNSAPTLQILSIKKVGAGPGSTLDRYRLIVSDGEGFTQSMMATQLNHYVDEGLVVKNTVIVVEKFTCNYVQQKRSDTRHFTVVQRV